MTRPPRRRLPVARVLVLLALALAAAYWLGQRGSRGGGVEPAPEVVVEEDPEAEPPIPQRAPPAPAAGAKAQAPASASCTPGASLRCDQGDVWSFDSCGEREKKHEECGDHLCRAGACVRGDQSACQEPAHGRCDGRTVVLCQAGRTQRIDCAAQGLTCAVGPEGAECVAPIPPSERCSGAPRCDGDVLVSCEMGRVVRTDCSAQRGQCLRLPGTRHPRCVTAVPHTAVLGGGCGPCGCPEDPSGELECDGRDEDNDRFIDEGLDCGPVPVLAFVVTDRNGQSSYAPEDIDAELARVNEYFASASSEWPLTFELADLIPLAEPELLRLDSQAVSRLAHDARIHPPKEEFHLPIVFTDEVVAGGGTPKFGVSTLPNGTCGGMQQRAGTELGVIAVSKARAPTTVAHEIGHYLGLCHTHDEPLGPALAVVGPSGGSPTACLEPCKLEGDGVCDTPFDPGPELCLYDATCSPLCRGGAFPDALNVMSYYTACRARFTPEQVRILQHTLALRRGWHACARGACTCELGDNRCPAGMSCRPARAAGGAPRCTLDGPLGPGADCRDTSECGRGALCLHEQTRDVKRCTRACRMSTADCQCVSISEGLSICKEDLEVR